MIEKRRARGSGLTCQGVVYQQVHRAVSIKTKVRVLASTQGRSWPCKARLLAVYNTELCVPAQPQRPRHVSNTIIVCVWQRGTAFRTAEAITTNLHAPCHGMRASLLASSRSSQRLSHKQAVAGPHTCSIFIHTCTHANSHYTIQSISNPDLIGWVNWQCRAWVVLT